MFDLDPRDGDSRDEERSGIHQSHRTRDSADVHDHDDWRQPDLRHRDQDDDARTLGRGSGDDSRSSHTDEPARSRHDDARWPERDRDARQRDFDHRDVFSRDLRLPSGLEREIVRDRNREYTLRGSESRTLATVGAFRVVSSRDVRDRDERPTARRCITCPIGRSIGQSTRRTVAIAGRCPRARSSTG